MRKSLSTLVVALSVPLTGFATVTFQNTGTISGWNTSSPQHKGTVGQVDNIYYKGPTALKMTQTFDGSYSGRYHAEVTKASTQSNGQDRYYGQVIRLSSSWVYYNGNATFQQFSPESPSAPWILNYVQGTGLKIVVPGVSAYANCGSISAGVWTRIVVRLKMTNPGIEEVWVNGVKTLSHSNINLRTPNGSPTIRWSSGLYMTYWYQKTSLPSGDQSPRAIWHDHHRIATSYSEAEPANW